MEELLSLKWNNHRSTFIHVLGLLRDKQLFTDATLACEEKFYSVHKLVLSTCSDYFSAILDRTNCKNPVIVLKDIKCEDLEALLDYMYLGEVNVRQGDLSTLIKAAECLRVKGLAVPDDEPPKPTKTKSTSNRLVTREDRSSSPPAKRKRRCDKTEDDNNCSEGKRSSKQADFKSQISPTLSSLHNNSDGRPCSPSNNDLNTPSNKLKGTLVVQQPDDKSSSPLPIKSSSNQLIKDSSSNQKPESDSSDVLAETFVKVKTEEDDTIETYNLSDDGIGGVKEEDERDSGSDLSSFFLQQDAAVAYVQSSFSGHSSFQPDDISGWQGDGSSLSFPQGDFSTAEGSSQQNTPADSGMAEHFLTPEEQLLESRDFSVANTQPSSSAAPEYFPRKEHSCPICQKHFGTPSKVTMHLRTHTGERPFPCQLCSYRATQASSLKRHVLGRHPGMSSFTPKNASIFE